MNPTKNLSPKEIAQDLGVSTRVVLSEIRKRRLRPVIRINRKTILVAEPHYLAYKQARAS